MKNRVLLRTVLSACVAYAAIGYMDAAKAPRWLKPLLKQDLEGVNTEAGAICLLDEAEYWVASDGKQRQVVRKAYFIEDISQRGYARISVGYEEGYSKVSEIRAWVVDPGGKVYRYGKKESWDEASDVRSLHSQLMRRKLNAIGDIREGSVFAFEYEVTENSIFSQVAWILQKQIPVLVSRVSISPPENWSVEMTSLNGASMQSRREGNSYVWEARNLQALKPEENAPVLAAYLPVVGFDLYPKNGYESDRLAVFRNWNDVARFDVKTNDSQIEPNEAIRAKVSELTSGKLNEREKVEAIAEYAQSVNYVAINTDLSMGGGYTPFAAAEVFERHYGDCKDKAALMRSMLSCLGIESYSVSIASEDRAYLNLDWPSPKQFDHCIVAFPFDSGHGLEGQIEDPVLGALLLFDPTSKDTPFGMLPDRYHGGFALVGSMQATAPTRIPETKPRQNLEKRKVRIALGASGHARCEIDNEYSGGQALAARSVVKAKTGSEYQELLNSWLTKGGVQGHVTSVEVEDRMAEKKLKLSVDCDLSGYARSLRDRFLIFKPFFLDQEGRVLREDKERKLPFVFRSRMREDEIFVSFPEGFELDDYSNPSVVKTDFAHFEISFEKVEGGILCKRLIWHPASNVPADRFGEVVAFFEEVARAEQAPIVLVRADS